MNSQLLQRHFLVPLILIVAFFGVAFSPVSLLGCRIRGLLAFGLALASGILAILAALRAIRGRLRGEKDSVWWIVTAMLCAVPLVAMLRLA
jgi:hypothetical protein